MLENPKAQSSMEYITTYGWAVAAIAVILGALFSIGAFNQTAALSTACVAQTGFVCKSPTYSHTTGQIDVELGQITGTSWTSVNVVFIPEGTNTIKGIPYYIFAKNSIANTNSLYQGNQFQNGETISLMLPVNGISTNKPKKLATPLRVGIEQTGTIWVQYTTSSTSGLQYAKIAAINVKAS